MAIPTLAEAENLFPASRAASTADIVTALADLDPKITMLGGITLPLMHTYRTDGTFDGITIDGDNATGESRVYFTRHYRGRAAGNVTGNVGRFPGWMVVLTVRALHDYVTRTGSAPLTDTAEGAILYALGLGPRSTERAYLAPTTDQEG